MTTIKIDNPMTYMKQSFPEMEKRTKTIAHQEAKRMKYLIEDEIREAAENTTELKTANKITIMISEDSFQVITKGKKADVVLKRMEYGSSDRGPAKPILKAIKRYERDELKGLF